MELALISVAQQEFIIELCPSWSYAGDAKQSLRPWLQAVSLGWAGRAGQARHRPFFQAGVLRGVRANVVLCLVLK